MEHLKKLTANESLWRSVPVILILEFHLLYPVIGETSWKSHKHAMLQHIKIMQALAKISTWSPFHAAASHFIEVLCETGTPAKFAMLCFLQQHLQVNCNNLVASVVELFFQDRQKIQNSEQSEIRSKQKGERKQCETNGGSVSVSTLARRISRESFRLTHFASKQWCKMLQQLFHRN